MRKINEMLHNKKFTLIELIVVIGILAILASMVIPNIKGIEGEARGAALATERKSVQTAVDMYLVDNIEKPVLTDAESGEIEEITMENPGIISMDKLYPEYLRDFPSTAGAKYWLDYSGKVWVSLADAPVISNDAGDLSWDAVDGAVEYIVYEYSETESNLKYNLSEVARVTEPGYSGESGKYYAVQSVDKQGNKSILAGIGYTGYPVEEAGEDTGDALISNEGNEIAAGGYHTLVKTTDGNLYAFGRNNKGQLGDGTTTNRLKPVKIDRFNSNVASVAAGNEYSLVKTTNGDLYAFGSNEYGQLGDGTKVDRYNAVKVLRFNGNVELIDAGDSHSLVKTTNGNLYAFGRNIYGQLGDGTRIDRNIAVKVLNFNENVEGVAGGLYHTVVTTSERDVYTFGHNNYGQLGYNTENYKLEPTPIIQFNKNTKTIAVGLNHTLIVTMDGDLYSFGWNYYGQLGDGTNINRSVPVKALIFDKNVEKVEAGDAHTIVKTNSQNLYAIGYNKHGELGNGSTTYSNEAIAINSFENNVDKISVGKYHTLVKTINGSLCSFGWNRYGEIGDGTGIERHTPTPITVE